MSIVIKGNDHLVNFGLAKAESMRCSDGNNFQIDRTTEVDDCMIIYDSQDSGLLTFDIVDINTEKKTNNIRSARKRLRVSSSSEESPDRTSRSVSPEIAYGTPAAYKIHQQQEDILIIKVPMNKSRTRTKKCSIKDIARLLDSEEEMETMFDSPKNLNGKVVGSLAKESPREAPGRLSRITRSASKESSIKNATDDYDSTEEEHVSLRIKLRRSTEQSNYKIQTMPSIGETTNSKKSITATPKKSKLEVCEEDNSYEEKTQATPNTRRKLRASSIRDEAKTPTVERMKSTSTSSRSRHKRRKMNNHSENEESDDGENDRDKHSATGPITRATRSLVKRNFETPQKRPRETEETGTPRSTRITRNSRLIDNNLNVPEEHVDKENKSDNDVNEDSSDEYRPRGRRITRSIVGTPLKQVKMLDGALSPRRTPRRRIVEKLEETTPEKTPRRAATRKINEPSTPSTNTGRTSRINTPSMKNGTLTPSMSRRTGNVSRAKTILEEARAKLHVSAVPKSLPCREEEFNDIYRFLERKLLDKSGGCIYISGVPGTGKTATVNEAIRCLRKVVAKGDLDNFDFVEINGMKLSEPRQAYVQILKQLNGQTSTWEHAQQILEKRFTQFSAKRPMTLLLVDELDLLCNKRQDVVYNLLDWPTKANAQLVVITIANTMDLPERVLMGRVTSRLGLTRLTFQPYTHKQLQEIVIARLKDSDAFKSEAIQLVARKVAAVSGDARRALDICRRATEIAESSEEKIVNMRDVNQALTEMIASAKVQAIKHCSEMEKMFLHAVCAEVTRTGVEETNFYNIYRQLASLCSFEGLKIPNVTQALGICSRLGANRLLLCEHSRTDTQQRILLNVSSDDIHFATQTTALV